MFCSISLSSFPIGEGEHLSTGVSEGTMSEHQRPPSCLLSVLSSTLILTLIDRRLLTSDSHQTQEPELSPSARSEAVVFVLAVSCVFIRRIALADWAGLFDPAVSEHWGRTSLPEKLYNGCAGATESTKVSHRYTSSLVDLHHPVILSVATALMKTNTNPLPLPRCNFVAKRSVAGSARPRTSCQLFPLDRATPLTISTCHTVDRVASTNRLNKKVALVASYLVHGLICQEGGVVISAKASVTL